MTVKIEDLRYVVTLEDLTGVRENSVTYYIGEGISDSGTVTGGSVTQMVDSTKSWVPNQFAPAVVVAGKPASSYHLVRVSDGKRWAIVSNTSTTLTITSNGVVPSGSYQIRTNRGLPIDVGCMSMDFSYKNFTDPRNQPNKDISESYSERKGEVSVSGINNPDIVLDCVLNLTEDLNQGYSISGSDRPNVWRIDYQFLFKLATVPTVLYLRDWQSSVASDGKTPISILMTDNAAFVTEDPVYTNGMPVTVQGVTGIKRSITDSEKGQVLRFKIELSEDK